MNVVVYNIDKTGDEWSTWIVLNVLITDFLAYKAGTSIHKNQIQKESEKSKRSGKTRNEGKNIDARINERRWWMPACQTR